MIIERSFRSMWVIEQLPDLFLHVRSCLNSLHRLKLLLFLRHIKTLISLLSSQYLSFLGFEYLILLQQDIDLRLVCGRHEDVQVFIIYFYLFKILLFGWFLLHFDNLLEHLFLSFQIEKTNILLFNS